MGRTEAGAARGSVELGASSGGVGHVAETTVMRVDSNHNGASLKLRGRGMVAGEYADETLACVLRVECAGDVGEDGAEEVEMAGRSCSVQCRSAARNVTTGLC